MPSREVRKLQIIIIFIAGICSVPWNALCQNKPVTQDSANQTLTFTAFVTSHGQTSEGYLFSENIYLASDGEKIYRRGVVYSSNVRANEELEKQLKGAANTLERKPITEKSRKVGERVVAVFSNGGGEKVLIFWIRGKVVASIEAPSLRHALAFEKFDKR
jgi:hypothetical protein